MSSTMATLLVAAGVVLVGLVGWIIAALHDLDARVRALEPDNE